MASQGRETKDDDSKGEGKKLSLRLSNLKVLQL